MARAVDPATSRAQSAKIQLVGRRRAMLPPVGSSGRKPQKILGDHATRGGTPSDLTAGREHGP
jgi:hypothetical protein